MSNDIKSLFRRLQFRQLKPVENLGTGPSKASANESLAATTLTGATAGAASKSSFRSAPANACASASRLVGNVDGPRPVKQANLLPESGVFMAQGYPQGLKFEKLAETEGYKVSGLQVTKSSQMVTFEGVLHPPDKDGNWHLIEHWEEDGRKFTELHSTYKFDPEKKQLVEMESSGTKKTFDLRKESDLPKATITAETKDPVMNWQVAREGFESFSAMWNTMKWSDERLDKELDTIEAEFLKNPTEKTLAEALKALVALTKDGHTTFNGKVDGEEIDVDGGPPRPLNSEWLEDHGDKLTAATKNYADGKALTTLDNEGYVRVGTMENGKVGYLAVDSMEGYVEGGLEDDIKVFNRVLDSAFAQLKKSDTVIIDLRQNGGGYDALARGLAERITDKERVSHRKQARDPDLDGSHAGNDGGLDAFADPYDVTVKPNGNERLPPDKKVIVLTSDITMSAAETAVLQLRGLPNVEVIGERTYGALSDMTDLELPNGWEMTLSNERYLTPDGMNFEHVGIPPDQELLIDKRGVLEQGKDNVLEAALESARAHQQKVKATG